MAESVWEKANEWERQWHDTIGANTFHEEEKQFVYAKRMGIEVYRNPHTPYNFKNYGKVIDIGGGETSMLLKVEKPIDCAVIDPCDYPEWIHERYSYKQILFKNLKGEDLLEPNNKTMLGEFDEAWIYNCLQHTEDPEKIIQNAKKIAKVVRIFEWIDTGVNVGHIQNLTEADLNKWLGGNGKVEIMNERGCYGPAYYGVFKGDLK